MTLFQQMPILPERKSFGAELAGSLGESAGRILPRELSQQLENRALQQRGFNLSGVRDPAMRQQLMQMQMQRMQNIGEAMAKEGLTAGMMPAQMSGMPQSQAALQQLPQAQQAAMPQQGMIPDATLEDIQARTLAKQQSEIQRQVQQGLKYGYVPDVETIRARQGKYGQIFEDALLKTSPEDGYSEELKAIARELGQNAYSSGKDEQTIAREATQLANRIANAKQRAETLLSTGPQRQLEQLFKGNLSRTDEKKLLAAAAAAVKPFVEIGAPGEAREYLAKAKWNPEQIESIIQKSMGTGFSESTRSIIASAPQFQQPLKFLSGPRKGEVYDARPLPKSAYPQVKDIVFNILDADPNANLVLLRKELEAKGVDWQSYKKAVDEAVLAGKINNRSKAYQYAERVLERPPVGFLDRIFLSYGIGGRG